MKRILLFVALVITLSAASCSKAKTHCFKCIDVNQVDPSFDVCSNDTTTSGRNAYNTLASGQHVYNTNGVADSCQGYDK